VPNSHFKVEGENLNKRSIIMWFLVIVTLTTSVLYIKSLKPQRSYPKDIFSERIPKDQQRQLFLQRNLEDLLSKLLGTDHFFVSVFVKTHSFTKETHTKTFQPKEIEEKVITTHKQEKTVKQEKRVDTSKKNVSKSGPRRKYVDSSGKIFQKLPGLLLLNNDKPTNSLPGFPSLQAPKRNSEEPQTEDKVATIEESAQAFDDKLEGESKENESFDTKENFSTEKINARQILNENNEMIKVPENKV
jgi:hypothetical protein